MKVILLLILLFNLSVELVFCQTKQLKIVFVSNQDDTATALNQIKIYTLKKKAINADFNYSKLSDIDGNTKDTLNIENLMPIFEPTNGHFTYYQFISTFKGHSFLGVAKNFHDILIIKTNSENKIIDAYQYTLEWAEPPLQFDLYKSDIKNLMLKNDLDIGTLKLSRKDYWNEKDRLYKESGLLKL